MKQIIALIGLFAISGAAWAAEPQEFLPATRGQMNAVQAEKLSRTPAQRKLGSQLHYLARETRGQRAVEGAPELRSRVDREKDGRVLVDIAAEPSVELRQAIADAGGTVLYESPRWKSLRASLPPDALAGLAARNDVKRITKGEKLRTHTGSVTTDGDAAHKAGISRSRFGVNGKGIKVGVISDSADYSTNSIAVGDLPASFTVLPGRFGTGAGEGTAMSEIVHDLAPGAQIYFASATGGKAAFADAILELRNAGCQIIVDDISYPDEWQFQDDAIGQAVNAVVAAGAVYLSSSGNEGNLKRGNSTTWEGDFLDGGAAGAPLPSGGRVHSFGSQSYNRITGSSQSQITLQWSDEAHSANNEYDLYVLNSDGTAVVAASTDVEDGTEVGYESVDAVKPGERIVVRKADGAAARYLRISSTKPLEFGTAGQTIGHAGTAKCICVAASSAFDALETAAGTFTTDSRVEDSSSDGPHKMFYNPDGTAITPGNFLASGGVTILTPAITAADGGATSLPSGGLNPFFGTSAAAPHAAAIAALVWSQKPALKNTQIRAVLEGSCLDIEGTGFDVNSGNGILMADLAFSAGTPVITQQPQAIAVVEAASATFTVIASNPTPLTYQWRRGDVNLSGATNATLTLVNVSREDSGRYSVRISSSVGSVDSVPAQLTVSQPALPPTILAQPRNQSAAQGANVVLSVTAQGSAPLAYQWTQDGADLPLAAASTLTFNNVTPGASGSYRVVVRNPFGAVTSIVAVLNVSATLVPPTITIAPRGETVNVGSTASFSVAANGSQPLAYQWSKNGQPVAGATAAQLSLPGVTANEAGAYTVTVSNGAGSVTSPGAILSVTAASAAQKSWTILVYGHADHNLSQSLVDDMIEMERVGSAAGFNIVVQSDFNASAPIDRLPPALKQGVSRFLIQSNLTSANLISPAIERLPELNQDDPVNLSAFVRWGITKYPAERFALILWDHGGQWTGFGHDGQDGTLQNTKGLMTAPLKNAVLAALQGTSVQKFDFFAFDTCLMGGAEVLGDMAELSDTYIACPEIDFGPGWDYTATFEFLKRNRGVAARDFAATEVEKWATHHFSGGYEADNMLGAHAAYDLTIYPAFKSAFFAFSPLVNEFATANLNRLIDIRRNTTRYWAGGVAELSTATKYTDLGELAQKLAAEPLSSPALKTAANTLVSSITNLIINTARGTGKRNGLGLSVFFPLDGDWRPPYDSLNFFATDNTWLAFLDTIYFAKQGDTAAPAIVAPMGTTSSANRSAPASLSFEIEDTSDLHRINGYLVSRTYTGDANDLVYLGQLFTKDDTTDLESEFDWNGTAPIIWGADSATGLYLGGFIDPSDPTIMTSYAEYLPPDHDESQFVILHTDLSGDNPRIIAVLDGETQSLAPRGIDLEPGGHLTPIYYVEYQLEGDPESFETYSILANESLIIPADGLDGMEVALSYLSPADYTVSMQTEDDFGNTSETIEFTVTIAAEDLALETTFYSDGFIEISWFDPYGDTVLETTADLGNPEWDEYIPNDYIDFDGDMRFFVFIPGDDGPHRFFRVSRP